MKTDDFEKRLRQLPMTEIPSVWREEILAAAQNASASRHAPRLTPQSFISTLLSQLSSVVRAQRFAWSGLAVLWIVIAAMNLTARDPQAFAVASSPLPTPETLLALRQQKLLLLAELNSQSIAPVADRPKVVPLGPRSQRREEIANV